jgi:glycosyltransferase involved in cell wall biosynthesis
MIRNRRPPWVSIIVPCRNSERSIGSCLDSIVATHYPTDRLEVFVVDGRSDDRTPEITTRYATAHRWLHLLDNPQRSVPAALNIGIRRARGDVIVRMDADSIYPPDYVPRLVAALEETGADIVGARRVTLPADSSSTAMAIALELSGSFGAGTSSLSRDARRARPPETVPFGCSWRDLFWWVGLFDEELIADYDEELNARLMRRGGRVLLVPDVVAFAYARPPLRQAASGYYREGYFRPLVARKLGRLMTARELVPAAFLASLVGSGAAALFAPAAVPVFAALGASYAIAVAASTLPLIPAHGLRHAVAVGMTLATLDASYGFGFLRGLWDLAFRRHRRRLEAAAVPSLP